MTNDHYNHNQSQNNGILQDIQDHCWEMLPPTQSHPPREQQSASKFKEKKKKCHGNRKLQHFKRKCRARGLTEEQIIIRIQNRNDTMSEKLLTNQAILPEQTHDESRKRKRDDQSIETKSLNSSIKSMSQLSMSQNTQVPKKNEIFSNRNNVLER
jgi:hypothetical protein